MYSDSEYEKNPLTNGSTSKMACCKHSSCIIAYSVSLSIHLVNCSSVSAQSSIQAGFYSLPVRAQPEAILKALPVA